MATNRRRGGDIRRLCSFLIGLGALAVLFGGAPVAQADIPASLKSSCAQRTPATGFGYKFCDDLLPPSGGRTPNVGGVNAVLVPAKYDPSVGGGWEGLPPKAPDASTVPGADTAGNVALDVDVSLPDPSRTAMPAGGYPLIVFMHGCCSGNKTSWEATSFDAGGEKWHYSNAWFASRGYVVVTYTARGFVNGEQNGNMGSTGEAQLDSRKYEINDYQFIAGLVADDPDLDPATGSSHVVKVDPQKVVTTGGSYGGGFSWLALTDPIWQSPGGKSMKLAATAPKYGWTDLIDSLVPTGRHSQSPDDLSAFDGSDSTSPVGIPKKSIDAALYDSGKTGIPPGSAHTTFPPSIDESFACLQSSDPFESNPLCANTINNLIPEFRDDRSAYYQNGFFTKIATDESYRIPIFNAATFSDPLFPAVENLRMSNRLQSIVPSYPIQQYFGDYNHFVQNKAKEWGDICGGDHHVCSFSDYPSGNLNATPTGLARTGVTTRLNRFIDHYAAPPGNPSEPQPAFNVAASLQICPQNAGGQPADEPGPTFTGGSLLAIAPGTLHLDMSGSQATVNDASPNTHATNSDPVANFAGPNAGKCPVETTPAGPGVATYDSAPLANQATMIGATKVSIDYSVSPANATDGAFQLNSRLYDLFPDGTAVMVDRGVRRVTAASGTVTYELHGNGWRFEAGHRIRIEIAQDDDPYVKASTIPSSATLTHVGLDIPVREGSDLAVTKSDSPDPVFAGQPLTYNVTVTNNGPISASGVTMTDTLPGTVSFVSANPSQGSCSPSGGTVACSLGTIANGGVATVPITVTPESDGTIVNSATVASSAADRNSANNTATASTTVNPAADLAVTKSDSPDPVSANELLTYTVEVTNSGPQTATGVILTDTLPNKFFRFRSARATQGRCVTRSRTVVVCNLGDIAAGDTTTATILLRPSKKGTFTNSATASASGPVDPVSANNTGTATTTVVP